VILGIMIGSIVSRAVTGNSPSFLLSCDGSVAGDALAVLLIAMHWHGFGSLIKDDPASSSGMVRSTARDAETHMTEHDLWEDLRGKSVSD
jgi:hypothetical protein